MLCEMINPTPDLPAYFNRADPAVTTVRPDREGRHSLDPLQQVLMPYRAKETTIGPRCVIAITETVAPKPAFRCGAWCLVPMDGFYERKNADRQAMSGIAGRGRRLIPFGYATPPATASRQRDPARSPDRDSVVAARLAVAENKPTGSTSARSRRHRSGSRSGLA